MIKSYKIVLIIQFVLLLALSLLFFKFEYGDEYRVVDAIPLLIISFSPLILLLLAIIIQKIIVAVLQSDSAEADKAKSIAADKFWKNSFFANLVFGAGCVLMAIASIVFQVYLGLRGYEFSSRLSVFIALMLFASLLIGLLFRVRDFVNEISKLLGILMILISVIIFAGTFMLGSNCLFLIDVAANDNVVGTLKTVEETPEEMEVTYGDEEDGYREGDDDPEDHFGFYKMNYPEIKIADNLGYGHNDSQSLFRLFLSKYLKLESDQSFNEVRSAIHVNNYYNSYPDITALDKKLRRDPEALRESFNGYKPLLYAFLSDRIYHESNLDALVNAFIKSHNDIYQSENPEESLTEIYKIMTTYRKEEFADYCYPLLRPYVSEDAFQSIKNEAETHQSRDNYEEGYGAQFSTVWIYSFWARRHKEKNDAVVFDILQEIKEHYSDNDDLL
ncbi:hypothetical protein B4N84_22325 [Flavobacterium sp. IR1]|nr:hypothetical protein B4N84_22325 [Flavobacterium sp. IR1]